MIPKIVWQFWDGPVLPDDYAHYVATWDMEGWEHRLLTYDDLELDTDQYLNPGRYQAGNHFRMAANIARFEILAEHGGLWVDCDMERVEDITPLTRTPCGLAAIPPSHLPATGIIAAVPHHPFIEACRQWFRDLEPSVHRRVSSMLAARECLTDSVTLWPSRLVYPNTWAGERVTLYADALVVNHPRSY